MLASISNIAVCIAAKWRLFSVPSHVCVTLLPKLHAYLLGEHIEGRIEWKTPVVTPLDWTTDLMDCIDTFIYLIESIGWTEVATSFHSRLPTSPPFTG